MFSIFSTDIWVILSLVHSSLILCLSNVSQFQVKHQQYKWINWLFYLSLPSTKSFSCLLAYDTCMHMHLGRSVIIVLIYNGGNWFANRLTLEQLCQYSVLIVILAYKNIVVQNRYKFHCLNEKEPVGISDEPGIP